MSRGHVRLARFDLAGFEGIAPEWEDLAARGGSPFLTVPWLASWWRAFALERGVALVLRAEDGEALAGGCFLDDGRALRSAANVHTNDWGVVARDPAAESRFWAEVAALGRGRLALAPLAGDAEEASAPREALRDAGYRLVGEALNPSPWLELPGSFQELLGARSRNLRSQVGRRRRRLSREGELTLRAVGAGPTLEADLDAFFALEAAGWKGREGTAISADGALLELYRGFARTASERGRLRLYLLELDGRLVAADYGYAFASCGFLVKTAFDESLAHLAPGLVLRGEVLRASIEEGLARYDFLGGPDGYKMRWADELRPRRGLYAFRGGGAIPAYAWRRVLRPRLKHVRNRARGRWADLFPSRRRRAGRAG